MYRLFVVMLLGACANESGTLAEPGTGLCSSSTRQPYVNSSIDILTTYDEAGREVHRLEESYSDDGSWQFAMTEERGYIDGRLSSVITSWDAAEDFAQVVPGPRRVVYQYDDQGLLVEERGYSGGEPDYTRTFTYDELGQEVGAVYLDAFGDVASTDERTWSEGRLERFERRGPEGNLFLYEAYDYLNPAPSLDAEVTDNLFYGWYTVRYDGERLIEREVLGDGPWGGSVTQWVWRDDGQVELERSFHPVNAPSLVRSTYDGQGRITAKEWGPDVDGDDVIDEVELTQTWEWSCD